MKFKYNSRIIEHLGKELITSDSIAFTELIKNSKDANATVVNLFFFDDSKKISTDKLVSPISEDVLKLLPKDSPLMCIEDNGEGMDAEILEKGFFEIGTDIKKKQKINSNEIILGEKGIGRLSAQRLSPILFVETTSNKSPEIILSKIEWSQFVSDKLAQSEDHFFTKGNNKPYTRLWFCGTEKEPLRFENYIEEKVIKQLDIFGNSIGKEVVIEANEDIQSAISFLFSPFQSLEPPLAVNLWYNAKRVIVDFHQETLKVAETVHSFSFGKDSKGTLCLQLNLKIQPWYIERIHFNEVHKELRQDYLRSPIFYKNLLEKYRYRYEANFPEIYGIEDLINKEIYSNELMNIFPIKGEVYSFKRQQNLYNMAINSAIENGVIKKDKAVEKIQSFLDKHNGVKLYRDRYRIGSLGDKDSDWLKFQQKRTVGQQYSRFELGNVAGYVTLKDDKQEYIYETSSREGIKDNQHKNALSKLLGYIFNVVFYEYSRTANQITKDILKIEDLIPQIEGAKMRKDIKETQELFDATKKNLVLFDRAYKVLQKNIDLDTPQKIQNVKDVFATLGEETNQFQDTLTASSYALKSIDKILIKTEQEKSRIEVESYNNYKLMANGLITEAITHELHSLLNGHETSEDYQKYFKDLRDFLLENKNYELDDNSLTPIKRKFNNYRSKVEDLQHFYDFIEKTFVVQGTMEEFESINVHNFLEKFENRFAKRLKKHSVELVYESIDFDWMLPKGTLTHLFYNLFDNAIYWIEERRKMAIKDQHYKIDVGDKIIITKVDSKTIRISDTGTGIINKYQHNLFLPRVTAKSKGRGMGLYIVKNLLESFGANIELLEDENIFGNRFLFEVIVDYKKDTDND